MFGEWLKENREAKGLTLEQAARAADVSRTTWTQYERGIHRPNASKMAGIAGALGVSVDEVALAAVRGDQ